MNCGIYKITNKANNKIYIGGAVDIRKRWNTHKSTLRKNIHNNGHLQKAWNKYWEQSFEFEVIEFCQKEKLIEREQFWLDLTDCCNPEIGYNILKFARSGLGSKRTLEARAKMSAWQIGREMPIEGVDKMRAAKRDLYKWPHADGCRCKCHECNYKRSEYSLAWKKSKELKEKEVA